MKEYTVSYLVDGQRVLTEKVILTYAQKEKLELEKNIVVEG